MKWILLITMQLLVGFSYGQKALGPINFGMSKQELKKVVRADPNMKLLTGQIHTDILGDRYWGYPEFIENEFVAIKLTHYNGNICSYLHIYNTYGISDLENDVTALIQFFNGLYGEPKEFVGYVHPGNLELGKKLKIASWCDGIKYVQVWEEYVNTVAYPVVIICKKEAKDNARNLNKHIKQGQVEKTKDMF